jgi:hypothetical protein
MFNQILSRIGHGIRKVIGSVGQPLRRLGEVAGHVGRFVADHHQHIAPLAHGLAMASGHQGAQQLTGAALAVSNMVSTRQALNRQNAAYAAGKGAGGQGSFNGVAGKFSNQM